MDYKKMFKKTETLFNSLKTDPAKKKKKRSCLFVHIKCFVSQNYFTW